MILLKNKVSRFKVKKHEIHLPISQEPTKLQLKKLKEYLKEMPVEEILSGLKFAKNRWTATSKNCCRHWRCEPW